MTTEREPMPPEVKAFVVDTGADVASSAINALTRRAPEARGELTDAILARLTGAWLALVAYEQLKDDFVAGAKGEILDPVAMVYAKVDDFCEKVRAEALRTFELKLKTDTDPALDAPAPVRES